MKEYLVEIISKSLDQFELEEKPEIRIEEPNQPDHGDAATNIAMMLAKPLRNNPRAIAQQLVDGLEYDEKKISAVEIAGPGFINFRFAEDYLFDELAEILKAESDYGKSDSNKEKRVLVEFVSANPTGPLTVGHGRNAVLGDTVARLLEWTGANVEREYYFNDAGRQMRVLGESVYARLREYVEEHSELELEVEFPEGGYQGEYIKSIAEDYYKEVVAKGGNISDDWIMSILSQKDKEDRVSESSKYAEGKIFADISATLERMGIKMDSFFNERSLYENGKIEETVEKLRELNLAYDEDGAVWFKTTEFGKEKDTVLVKSTGEPTYRLPDIAYHANKLDRGFDLCVDVFGADHIATYPDVLSGIKSLGYDPEKVDVVVYQFVTIVKDGKPFKMSTRKANFVTLDELMDEVGADVTRFFFLMRSPNTHLEFDIAQAKEAGEKNPVFYLQYAHARIASILRKVEDEYDFSGEVDLSLLNHPTEITLIKTILKFPETIATSARNREPHHVITFLNELASDFTSFYHDCRILGEDESLAQARMELAKAVAQVLRNGLGILGITAPDQM